MFCSIHLGGSDQSNDLGHNDLGSNDLAPEVQAMIFVAIIWVTIISEAMIEAATLSAMISVAIILGGVGEGRVDDSMRRMWQQKKHLRSWWVRRLLL